MLKNIDVFDFLEMISVTQNQKPDKWMGSQAKYVRLVYWGGKTKNLTRKILCSMISVRQTLHITVCEKICW